MEALLRSLSQEIEILPHKEWLYWHKLPEKEGCQVFQEVWNIPQ